MGVNDPMLESVRDDPRFIELMNSARAALDAERAWVERMSSMSPRDRLHAMLLDAEAQLQLQWQGSDGGSIDQRSIEVGER